MSIYVAWKRTSRYVSKNYLQRDLEILYDPEIYFLIFTRKVIFFFLMGSPYDVFALQISASSIAIFYQFSDFLKLTWLGQLIYHFVALKKQNMAWLPFSPINTLLHTIFVMNLFVFFNTETMQGLVYL